MSVKIADNAKTVFLKVTSAFMLGGEIAKAGEVVEVGETDAKDLLHRGKAVLAVVERSDLEAAEAAAKAKAKAESKAKAK